MKFSLKVHVFCCFSVVLFLICTWVHADVHPNLTHWWQFNETSGSVAEDSVGTAEGILRDGASWMIGAVHFDGVNDYIDLPDGFADLSSGFTISLWVYPTNNARWGRFIDFGNGTYADNIIFARYYNTNSVVFQCYNGSSTAGTVIANDVLQLETWQLLTVTLDTAGNVKIYKNGNLVKSGVSSPAAPVTRTNNYVGKSNWTSDEYYQGLIEDVRIYNVLLSTAEIQALAADVPPDIPNVPEIWVDDDYVPLENDGHTWLLDAFDNIQDAMNAADYGDIIHVNAGIYYCNSGSLILKSGVKLIGQQPETTIIDGTPVAWVLPFPAIRSENCDPNTRFEGFTVRNAGRDTPQSNNGGAMYNYRSHLTIRNCIFVNNKATAGGAIYNDPGYSATKMVIEDCTFLSNTIGQFSNGNGGAIYGLAEGGMIRNCTFTGNSVKEYGKGGAMAVIDGTVTHCTFTGNFANAFECEGGALYAIEETAVISDCVFSNNCAVFEGTTNYFNEGGAISSCRGRIQNCVFEGNAADRGGAIYSLLENAADCTFSGNTAALSGGAISCPSIITGTATVVRCKFIGNHAEHYGGALEVLDHNMTIEDCRFLENVADRVGGAVWCDSGDLIIGNSQFISNRNNGVAPALEDNGWGGAVYIGSYSHPVITNCLFAKNSAFGSGGALSIYGFSNPKITLCTLVDNTSGDRGGSLYMHRGCEPVLSSTILWGNTAAVSDSEIAVDNMDDPYVSLPVIRYSNIAGCGSSGINWNADFGSDGGGNIDADPLFSDDPNDFHLKSQAGRYNSATDLWETDAVTSPCIDAGDPFAAIGKEPFPNGGYVNMGAYGGTAEASKSYFGTTPCDVIVAGDINGDCVIDLKDLLFLGSNWLVDHRAGACEVVMAGDINTDCIIDLLDISLLATDWLIDNRLGEK